MTALTFLLHDVVKIVDASNRRCFPRPRCVFLGATFCERITGDRACRLLKKISYYGNDDLPPEAQHAAEEEDANAERQKMCDRASERRSGEEWKGEEKGKWQIHFAW